MLVLLAASDVNNKMNYKLYFPDFLSFIVNFDKIFYLKSILLRIYSFFNTNEHHEKFSCNFCFIMSFLFLFLNGVCKKYFFYTNSFLNNSNVDLSANVFLILRHNDLFPLSYKRKENTHYCYFLYIEILVHLQLT